MRGFEISQVYDEVLGKDRLFPIEQESKEKKGERKKSIPGLLMEIAEQEIVEVFHDQDGTPWGQIPVGDHTEHYPIQSQAFRDWLERQFWLEHRRVPYPEATASVLRNLAGRARFEGQRHPLSVRTTWHEGALWVDLADEHWRAVRIKPGSWEVIDDPPVIFRRIPHQRPLQVADRPGELDLHAFVNLASEEDHLLLLVWLVTSFIPGFPHPVVIFHGPQGAGKTTAARILKSISDPHEAEVISVPRDPAELAQALHRHNLLVLDNLSNLPTWVSDALCRCVSGEGFEKRRLYTNEETVLFKYQRCVVLTGINIVATRPDLLDRSLIVGLERIETVKSEAELWREFNACLPGIRTAIFDVLAKALEIEPCVKLERSPRMADFARWGVAVAEALGGRGAEFLEAYYENIGTQHEAAIEASPVATALVAFLNARSEWRGTASELLEELEKVCDELHINRRAKGWPSQPNVLTRILRRLKTTLEGVGVIMEEVRTGKKRTFRFFRKSCDLTVTTVTVPPGQEGRGVLSDGQGDDREREPSQESSPRKASNCAIFEACDDGDDQFRIFSESPDGPDLLLEEELEGEG